MRGVMTRGSIKKAEELKGKKIGSDRYGSFSDLVLREALRHYNLAPDRDVAVIQTGGLPERLGALKIGGGGSESDSVVPQEVERVMQQVSETIANDVQRSLDFYGATAADATIHKIFLSGGCAKVPALAKAIEAEPDVGTVVAYAFGWGWNGLFNQVVVAVRPDRIAAATGMTQGGVFLGGTVGPLSFAAIVHAHGYEPAWLIAAGAALAAVVTVVTATCIAHRTGQPDPAHHIKESSP